METIDCTFKDAISHQKETLKKLYAGEITAEALKLAISLFRADLPIIRAELQGRTVKQLAGSNPRGYKKAELIESIIDSQLNRFIPQDGSFWSPSEETYQEATDRQINAITDEQIQAYAAKLAKDTAARAKELSNPETLWEFSAFISSRGFDALSDEQITRYDILKADNELAAEKVRQEQRAVVAQVALGEVGMTLHETKHTKKGIDLWVIQLSDRIEREGFDELNIRAKQLGGYYSSYRGGGAIPGFTFERKDLAERFMQIGEADQDRSDLIAERQAETTGNAVERLREMAGRMETQAEESLGQEREVNTCRRARMAASAEAEARTRKRYAATMRNLADAIEQGKAKYLGGIRTRAQVETLESVLYRAKWAHVHKVQKENGAEGREIEQRDVNESDLRFVEYPFPSVDESTLQMMIEAGLQTPGVKRVSASLKKWAPRAKPGTDWIKFEGGAEDLRFLTSRLLRRGGMAWRVADVHERCIRHSRMTNAGIHCVEHLRAALREYLLYRGARIEADPILALERSLIGLDIPDFFPTPPSVIEKILEQARLEPDHSVLEPSAGKGDIADAVKEIGCALTCAESSMTLKQILCAKGHLVASESDFLTIDPGEHQFDRVLMNPPFSELQDVDHVMHAFKFLKPGGRLVAIMSESPFFRDDRKAVEFRTWLDNLGGVSEPLPADSFSGSDSFRKTGVNTRIVTLDK